MTNPKFAEHLPGKGRWYAHPETGETWPSVTNVLDTGVAKQALVPWAAKATAAKAWDSLPQMVAAYRIPQCKARKVEDKCGRCADCLNRALKGEHKLIRDTAADLGTRIHNMADAHAKGQPLPDDPEALPFFQQVLRFFDDWGVDIDRDIVAAEATVINRQVGYAGTGDLWVWLNLADERRLILVDYKSSSTRPVDSVYLENGMQLAALAHGETVLLDDGTEEPCPGPIHGAAVLNLRIDDYALIPMPYDGDLDAAFAAFQGALATALYVHGRYGEKPRPMAAPTGKRAAA